MYCSGLIYEASMGNRGSAGDSVVWQAQLLHTMLQAAEDIHRTRVSIIHSRMAVYCMRFGIQEARFGFDSVRLCLSLSLPLCIVCLTVSLFLSWLNVVHGWTVGRAEVCIESPFTLRRMLRVQSNVWLVRTH